MNEKTVTATLSIQDLAAELHVFTVRGSEAMSALYRFELVAESHDVALDFDALVGKTAVLRLAHGALERYVHGIVAAFEQSETAADLTRYSITLVPELWLLSQGTKCRIFQGATAPQIVATVLTEAGLSDHEITLQGSYAERELCVQYSESNWDFLSRLLAEEGIFYFFRHEEGSSRLVLADRTAAHPSIGHPEQIGFFSAHASPGNSESIESFRLASRIRPGKVTLREVPFYTPTLLTEAEASAAHDSDVQVYAYGEGIQAQSRLDAYQAERKTAHGLARSVRLFPGATFALSGHPRASFDSGYLVTAVESSFSHTGKGDDVYSATFHCIPEGTPWRPAARAKARIVGPQSALVVGPEGSEIHVDGEGRVLVKLEWDRGATGDLAGACWVHVSQGASGASHGQQAMPRVGSYVLVDFLNGDPDRPIITGRVYNSVSPYPYPPRENKSKSSFKSRSTPGSSGYNELRFDDQTGAEQVLLRAERDLDAEAQNDATRTIGGNDTLAVTGNRTVTVAGSESTAVALAQSLAVGAAQSVTVGAGQSVLVTGDRTLAVTGDLTEAVSGNHADSVSASRTTSIGGTHTVVIGAGDDGSGDGTTATHGVTIYGNEERTITGDQTISIAGNHSLSVSGTMQRVIDGEVACTLTSLSVGVTTTTAFTGAGEVKIESAEALKLGGPYVYVSADSTLHMRAYSKIVLEVATSETDDDTTRLEITSNGIYLTNGSVTEKLSGGTIKLNC